MFVKGFRNFIPILFLFFCVSCASNDSFGDDLDYSKWKTNYPYVFVHGLAGWGDYEAYNSLYSYWGLSTGSIPKQLNTKGFNCVSASMAKKGSAWDRTCELYAQLTGSVVDYGVEHSTRCNHSRFGADYSKRPLVKKWDSENKINLIAHSFGSVVSRMLIELMEYGSEEEQAVTPIEELSPLFKGNHSGYVNCLVACSSPHNGVSAMTIYDEGIDVNTLAIKMLEYSVSSVSDGRVEYDCTGYDMHIDVAAEINEKLSIHDDIYYFSIPANASHRMLDGKYIPIKRIMENLFVDSSYLIGKYRGQTPKGFIIDEDWRENDGIVNLISAKAPFTEPSTDFDINDINPGVWNVMPPIFGDHLALVGGMEKKYDTMKVYVPLFDLINCLE